ncbi:hypothetical protein U9M48_038431 [Paspalum notatum var. saurae]|uniref:Uncharacterized protein n=1 Tax=Paspalum notatum var. saurae TaxID=547442 RepID=A0AAQ3UGU7_PASNO
MVRFSSRCGCLCSKKIYGQQDCGTSSGKSLMGIRYPWWSLPGRTDSILATVGLSSHLVEMNLSHKEDLHSWKHESSGTFSSKSTYRAFFHEAVLFEPRRTLESFDATQCKVLLWFAIHRRC